MCTEVREAIGRSSKFAAREVQLVVEILWQILGRAKVCVVGEQWAIRGGKGHRVVICERKRVLLTLVTPSFQRRGLPGRSEPSIFCTSVRGQLIQMKKQRSVTIPQGAVRASVCSRRRRFLEKRSVGKGVDIFERCIFAKYAVVERKQCVNDFYQRKIWV